MSPLQVTWAIDITGLCNVSYWLYDIEYWLNTRDHQEIVIKLNKLKFIFFQYVSKNGRRRETNACRLVAWTACKIQHHAFMLNHLAVQYGRKAALQASDNHKQYNYPDNNYINKNSYSEEIVDTCWLLANQIACCIYAVYSVLYGPR